MKSRIENSIDSWHADCMVKEMKLQGILLARHDICITRIQKLVMIIWRYWSISNTLEITSSKERSGVWANSRMCIAKLFDMQWSRSVIPSRHRKLDVVVVSKKGNKMYDYRQNLPQWLQDECLRKHKKINNYDELKRD